MVTLIKPDAIKSLKLLMKDKGYRTQGNYWFKESNDIVQFVAVQGSQWNKNDFYVNVGIMKKSHVTKKCHPDYEWEIWFRYPGNNMQPEPDNIMAFVIESHNQMSSIKSINSIYNEGKLPQNYFRDWNEVCE
jgi:hypothetical protein